MAVPFGLGECVREKGGWGLNVYQLATFQNPSTLVNRVSQPPYLNECIMASRCRCCSFVSAHDAAFCRLDQQLFGYSPVCFNDFKYSNLTLMTPVLFYY